MRFLIFVIAGTLIVFFGGCSDSSPATTAVVAEKTASRPEKAKKKNVEPVLAKRSPSKPPFPTRNNPFSRPQTDVTTTADPVAGVAIKLKGFVNSDQQTKAIISIGGKPLILANGEERNGLRVVEISAKEVILERGRQRWTAKLFE